MNNKWLVIGLIVAIVALVAVIAFGAYALTQRPFAQAYGPRGMMNSPVAGGMMRGRGGFGGFAPQNSLLAIAAKDLNLSPTDLGAALQSGKSIADIAKEKNVATDTIVNDFVAARSTQLKSAVDSKQITQAQADATLALVKANAQAEITRQFTARAFGNRPFGGQNFPMMGGSGMMRPRGGWR